MIGTLRLPASLPPGPPLLLAVVDTEEEFDWSAPFDRARTAVTNIAAQHLAQAIFAPAGIVPTYVIDYPVATDATAVSILRGFVDSGQALVGAHLHPWVNPPHDEEVNTHNSYAGNLPAALEHAKLAALTQAIARAFPTPPRILKAGRYGVGPHTAAALRAQGYDIDLSVVPHTDFGADGGPDYRAWPDRPFWAGAVGDLFCVPMTRGYSGLLPWHGLHAAAHARLGRLLRLPGLLARLRAVERATLTPEGIDLGAHKRLVRAMLDQGHRVFTLSYHSPSLVAGNTPYVRDAAELARFLDTLRRLVEFFLADLGATPITPPALRKIAEAGAPATCAFAGSAQ